MFRRARAKALFPAGLSSACQVSNGLPSATNRSAASERDGLARELRVPWLPSCSRVVSGQGALCRACLDAGGVRQCRQRPAAVRQAAYPACSRSGPQSWLRFVRPSSNRLADKNLDVPVGDERRNEVPPLVARFPASAVDASVASPLTHPPPRRCRSRLRPCL